MSDRDELNALRKSDRDELNALRKLSPDKPLSYQERVDRIPGQTPEMYQSIPPADPEKAVRPTNTMVHAAMQGAMAIPVMAGAARGLQALTAGLPRVAPYTAALAESVIPKTGRDLLYQGLLGTTGGVAGELAAREVPKEWGTTAEIVGGVLGGMATGVAVQGAKNLTGIYNTVKGLFSRGPAATANEVVGVLGASAAPNQAIAALVANPNLAKDIARSAEIEAQTGVSLPMLAAANGDTTISSYLQSQISKGDNTAFTAKIHQQYVAAEDALGKFRNGMAITREQVDDLVKRNAAESQRINDKRIAERAVTTEKRDNIVATLDNRISSLADEVRDAPGNMDTGNRLSSLLDAKKKAVMGELSPLYKDILETNTAAGVTLSREQGADLARYATDAQLSDVFNKHPTLFSAIKRVFAPAEQQAGTTALGSGRVTSKLVAREQPSPTQATEGYKLEDVDSLKRAVNKALRDNTDPDKGRILLELRNKVSGAIDSIDPSFSAPYKALDEAYATKLGIPFHREGVLTVDRARFVENTVNAITKQPSGLKDVLAIVGNDKNGMKIVEDAFMYDISNSRSIINSATGEVNPVQLQRYLTTNKEKLDLIPDVRAKLEKLATNTQSLQETRTAILTAEKNEKVQLIENLWTKAYGTSGGLQKLVKASLGNPEELDKLLAVTGRDVVAKSAVKGAFLDDILTAAGDRMAILEANKDALSKVFGTKDYDNLRTITEASMRLRDNPFALKLNTGTIAKSDYQSITGSTASQTAGELRSPIISFPRTAINHISRFFSHQADKNTSVEMQAFLLDPKQLQRTAELMSEFSTRGLTDKAIALLKRTGQGYLGSMLISGAAGGLAGSQSGGMVGYGTAETTPLLRGFNTPPEDNSKYSTGFNAQPNK